MGVVQRDPGLAVRVGRQLREAHYKRLGLDMPEHGKGHFHHPMHNYRAEKDPENGEPAA